MKPRILDAFAGQGGATAGLQRAGFHVTAVDIVDYSAVNPADEFVQADALSFIAEYGHTFDAIWTGPPCQGFSIATAGNRAARAKHPRLIAETRWQLSLTGRPYVIENVAQARSELIDPVMLCGRMFGLETNDEDGEPLVLDRHRLFESNIPLTVPPHPKHDGRQVAGVYTGGRGRKPGMTAAEHRYDCKYGRRGGYVPASREVRQALLGIDWMTDKGMAEAIPPVYAYHIGRQLAAHVKGV